MWIKRIIWIILLFFSLVLYIFVNSSATLTVLIALLIIPAISYIFMKAASGKINIKHIIPSGASKGEDIETEVVLSNKSFLPVGNIQVSLECRNVRTGDAAEINIDSGAVGKNKSVKKCVFKSPHCGRLDIKTKNISVKDILGMFKTEKELQAGGFVTVYPDRFPVNVSLSNSASALLEGDKYSRNQTGNDSSETMGIKEYVPGDPVKNMHWKLSAKTDKLLVKEFGTPIVDQVCLLLDMSVPDDRRAGEIDAIADVFASITDAMLETDIEPEIGWQDPESGVLNLRQVRSEEELTPTLEDMMGVGVKSKGISISEAVAMQKEKLSFAHVVTVGVSPDLDMSRISNGARATLILPDTETMNYGLQKDGTDIIAFSSNDYKRELEYIEI